MYLALTAMALAVSLFVETSSWWLKGAAVEGNLGRYVGRSNIYLYGGRFFSLLFTVILAWQIERGIGPTQISLYLAISFATAAFLQAGLLLIEPVRVRVMPLIARLMLLGSSGQGLPVSDGVEPFVTNRHALAFGTVIASTFFGLGVSLPSFLASAYMENRLVISNVGQIINSIGMVVTLLFIDQKLYSCYDNGTLPFALKYYSIGRVASCAIIAVSYAIFYQFLAGW